MMDAGVLAVIGASDCEELVTAVMISEMPAREAL